MIHKTRRKGQLSRIIVALIATMAMFGMIAPGVTLAGETPEPGHTVYGTVEDEGNNSVDGATIEATTADGEHLDDTTTDVNGEYQLDVFGLEDGEEFTVSVLEEGELVEGDTETLAFETAKADEVPFAVSFDADDEDEDDADDEDEDDADDEDDDDADDDDDDDTSAPGGGGFGGGPAPADPAEQPDAAVQVDPQEPVVGEDVTLDGTDSTVDDADIETYEWDIDGADETGDTVTTQFDAAGEYTVSLTVTADSGLTDTTVETVTVEEPESEPTAAIALDPESPSVDEDVTLDASDSSVETGEIDAFEWTIDGESETGESVTTSFDETGDVDIELTITADDGETETTTATLTVDEDADEDDDDEIPGFGIAATIVALALLTAFIATRRQ